MSDLLAFIRRKEVWKNGECPLEINQDTKNPQFKYSMSDITLNNGEKVKFEVNRFNDGLFVNITPVESNSEVAKIIGKNLWAIFDTEGLGLYCGITNEASEVEEVTIDENFIFRDDLRDWVFKEDKDGKRYRERIMEQIKKYGTVSWFLKKGYPIGAETLWKNRYTGSEYQLKALILNRSLEEEGYYVWENYLPKDLWNDKDLFDKYRTQLNTEQEVKK